MAKKQQLVSDKTTLIIMMLCNYAGPLGSASDGDICEINEDLAKDLVESMNAKYVTLKQDDNKMFAYEGDLKLKRIFTVKRLNGEDLCSNRVKEGV